MFTCLPCRKLIEAIHTFLARYRSGGTPLQPLGRVPEHLRDDVEGPGPTAALEASRLFVLLNHCSTVGFGRQHILARPVGPSAATTSTSASEMAEEPVK